MTLYVHCLVNVSQQKMSAMESRTVVKQIPQMNISNVVSLPGSMKLRGVMIQIAGDVELIALLYLKNCFYCRDLD